VHFITYVEDSIIQRKNIKKGENWDEMTSKWRQTKEVSK
jgi:hypothetical protein